MKIFIKREQLVATVTDYYLDTVAEALRRAGHSVTSSYEWDGMEGCEMAVIIAATRAPKLWKAKLPYLYWAQGLWPEESRMRGAGYPKYLIQSTLERLALKKAEYVFFVSDTMRRHYEKKYRLHFEGRCCIMPCANEQLHPQVFSTPGKYEGNIFCYAGGLAKWQCFEQTVALYAQLERKLPGAKLLLLVKAQAQALEVLQKYGVKNYEIDYVPVQELPEKLAQVKFGFLLRQESPVNAVATPTKVVTYLANGVIPIYSRSLHSVRQILEDCPHSVQLPDAAEAGIPLILDMTNRHLQAGEVQQSFERIFNQHYCREKYVERIASDFRARPE